MSSSMESQGSRPAATPLPPDYKPKVSRQAKKLIERIKRDHGDEAAVAELRAYYESLNDQPSLANLLEGWGAVLHDPARAAEAFMAAAEAVLAGSGDRARARYLCELALARDPAHPAALNLLCDLLQSGADHVHLEQRLRFLVSALRAGQHDPAYVAQVLYRLGQVHQHQLQQPAAARRAYREALELNPRFVPAIIAARQIYLASEGYAAAAVLFEMQVAASDVPEDRAALLMEAAKLRAGPLDDLDAAILAYRLALREQPQSVAALDELAAALLQRAERSQGEAALQDRARAAHALFQGARLVPRADAAPRLERCLALQPDHPWALAMQRELSGHGATAPEPIPTSAADRPQAVLDAQATRRAEPVRQEAPAAPEPAQPHESQAHAEAWLTTGEIEVLDEPSTAQLGPITERPPPPSAPSEPATSAAQLAERLRLARERADARRSSLPPPPPVPDEAAPNDAGPAAGAVAAQAAQPQALESDVEQRVGARLVDRLDEALQRMPVEVNLGATTEANLYVGFDNRVRAGGVFVPTYAPLNEGAPVLLQVTMPGGFETRAHGQVRFVRDAFDFTAEQVPGMGVQFEALTPEGLALCERFAQKRAPMFYED